MIGILLFLADASYKKAFFLGMPGDVQIASLPGCLSLTLPSLFNSNLFSIINRNFDDDRGLIPVIQPMAKY